MGQIYKTSIFKDQGWFLAAVNQVEYRLPVAAVPMSDIDWATDGVRKIECQFQSVNPLIWYRWLAGAESVAIVTASTISNSADDTVVDLTVLAEDTSW